MAYFVLLLYVAFALDLFWGNIRGLMFVYLCILLLRTIRAIRCWLVLNRVVMVSSIP